MRSKVILALGVLGVALSAGSAYATVVSPAPEISPTSVSAGLAALAGGVLILRAWRRR